MSNFKKLADSLMENGKELSVGYIIRMLKVKPEMARKIYEARNGGSEYVGNGFHGGVCGYSGEE